MIFPACLAAGAYAAIRGSSEVIQNFHLSLEGPGD